MMFGYATNETENYMPLALDISHKILIELAKLRREGKDIHYLRPDSKSQVTIEYNDDNTPQRIDAIVISTQHDDFDTDQANLLHELLLTAPTYPYKTMLLPVIERGSDAHGSMPAGESTTVNPFVQALISNSIAEMNHTNDDNNNHKDSYDYQHLLDRYSRAD